MNKGIVCILRYAKMKEDHLKAFLYDIEIFQNKLNAYQQKGNEKSKSEI